MRDFLISHYDLWRALHIITVIAWMAGIMYLPRLYAYHTRAGMGSGVARDYFEQMERKLLTIIMNPAMGLAILFGAILIYVDGESRHGWRFLTEPWMIVKLIGVVFMIAWHHMLARARKQLLAGTSTRSEKFWRATNELPFLAMIVMVIAVTTEFGMGHPLF